MRICGLKFLGFTPKFYYTLFLHSVTFCPISKTLKLSSFAKFNKGCGVKFGFNWASGIDWTQRWYQIDLRFKRQWHHRTIIGARVTSQLLLANLFIDNLLHRVRHERGPWRPITILWRHNDFFSSLRCQLAILPEIRQTSDSDRLTTSYKDCVVTMPWKIQTRQILPNGQRKRKVSIHLCCSEWAAILIN